MVGEVLDGEAVLLDLTSGKYFALNATATRMWQLLSEDGDPDTVVRALLAEVDTDEPTLRADLERLVADLVGRGILVERE